MNRRNGQHACWMLRVSLAVVMLMLAGVPRSAMANDVATTADAVQTDIIDEPGVEIHDVPYGAVSVYLEARTNQSRHDYVVTWDDGRTQRLSPHAYARLLYEDRRGPSGWWYRLLNISSPIGIAWVVMGFLGQLLFTGRMIVQWLASERSRRSVVPPAFWWMSLAGATMLMVYFIWRRDVVGVFGQGTGWLIYLRNLWLIYRPREVAASVEVAASSSA